MGKAGVIAITAAIALIVGLSLVERAADTGNVTPDAVSYTHLTLPTTPYV